MGHVLYIGNYNDGRKKQFAVLGPQVTGFYPKHTETLR